LSSRLLGTQRIVTQAAAATSGRGTRNIQRQWTASTAQPPSSGHTAEAAADPDVHTAIARPRSAGTKEVSMMATTAGAIRAAPAPCTSRAATSSDRFGPSAQPTDPVAKTAAPTRKILRRPKRSPAEPPGSSNAASASR
jgi:hypothetical protein